MIIKTSIILLHIMVFFIAKPTTALSPTLTKKSTALDVLALLNKSTQLAPYANSNGVAVVTGGNSGIGAVSVATLALTGMKVVLCARNVASAEQIKQDLPDYCQELVDIQMLDLADLRSVEQAAKDIIAKHGSIDLLLNNAGVMALPSKLLTAQGLEMQFGTNHVGHFAFTRFLMPHVKPNGRVVTVASTAHKFATSSPMNWDPAEYTPWGAYGQSKLANIIFAKGLQDMLVEQGRSDVTSVSLHPGVIGTGLWKFMPWFMKPFTGIITDKTVDQGAATNVFCSLANAVVPGAYYSDCKPTEPTTMGTDEKLRKELWDYTEVLIADKGFTLPKTLAAVESIASK